MKKWTMSSKEILILLYQVRTEIYLYGWVKENRVCKIINSYKESVMEE